jgi:hypothetical protein
VLGSTTDLLPTAPIEDEEALLASFGMATGEPGGADALESDLEVRRKELLAALATGGEEVSPYLLNPMVVSGAAVTKQSVAVASGTVDGAADEAPMSPSRPTRYGTLGESLLETESEDGSGDEEDDEVVMRRVFGPTHADGTPIEDPDPAAAAAAASAATQDGSGATDRKKPATPKGKGKSRKVKPRRARRHNTTASTTTTDDQGGDDDGASARRRLRTARRQETTSSGQLGSSTLTVNSEHASAAQRHPSRARSKARSEARSQSRSLVDSQGKAPSKSMGVMTQGMPRRMSLVQSPTKSPTQSPTKSRRQLSAGNNSNSNNTKGGNNNNSGGPSSPAAAARAKSSSKKPSRGKRSKGSSKSAATRRAREPAYLDPAKHADVVGWLREITGGDFGGGSSGSGSGGGGGSSGTPPGARQRSEIDERTIEEYTAEYVGLTSPGIGTLAMQQAQEQEQARQKQQQQQQLDQQQQQEQQHALEHAQVQSPKLTDTTTPRYDLRRSSIFSNDDSLMSTGIVTQDRVESASIVSGSAQSLEG